MTVTKDPSTENNSAPTPAPKKKRRWLKILLALVVVGILLVVLAPTMLSTGPGRNFILSQINSHIPGKIHLTGLSVGWLSSASTQGFELHDPDGKLVLSFNEASTGVSILSYLTHPNYDLGDVKLTNMHGDIVTYPDGTTNLTRALFARAEATAPAQAASTAPPTPTAAAKAPVINANLDAQIDQITFTAPNAPPLSIEKSSIKLRTQPDAADINVVLVLHSGNAAPTNVSIVANVANLRADHPTGTGRAQISSLDLATLAPLLSAFGVELVPTGTFNADLNFSSTADAAILKGTPTIDQFTLTGPALRGDTLRSATVKFPLDIQFHNGIVTLAASGLESDLLSVKISGTTTLGTLSPSPKPVPTTVDLTGNVDYDLAKISAALPHWQPPKPLVIEGHRSMPIHIKGPLLADAGIKKILKLQIDATPGWDRASYSGIELGKGDVPLALRDGILTITPTDIPANGGTFRAMGTLDLNPTSPVFSIAHDETPHHLLSNIALNGEIAGGPLRMLPLMWGASGKDRNLVNVTGQANLDVADAYLPFDYDTLKTKGTLHAVINIDKLHTEAPIFSQVTGIVGGLAKITGLQKTTSMDGDIKDITIVLNNGKFHYEHFRLGSSAANLTFTGDVGLDESLAMNIEMGTVGVNVPIPIALAGTISSPHATVSENFTKDLGKNLENLGKGAQDIGKEVGKDLGGLFKKKDPPK